MTSDRKRAALHLPSQAPAPRLVMERTYRAAIESVWELWTTAEGLEAWWGPSGFVLKVTKLEVRSGGALWYAMTATAPGEIDRMREAGMPVMTESRATYTEVVPQRRLAFAQPVDFIPHVAPYVVETTVDFYPVDESVRMILTFDAMHEEAWTERVVKTWETELVRLGNKLGR